MAEAVLENPEELDQPEEIIIQSGKMKGLMAILTPEGLIFMPLAVLLDLIGIILLCFGLDDFGITDTVGLLTIGFWAYFRSNITKGTEETFEITKTAKRLGWLRPLLMVLEYIPYVGDILPDWTILVYLQLQN